MLQDTGAQEAARARHEQARRHPLARDIADRHAERAGEGFEQIVEIAADFERRLHPPRNVPAGGVEGDMIRHHADLETTGLVEFERQAFQLAAVFHAQMPPLQRRAHTAPPRAPD